jgi:hypothetical protein
MLDDLVPIRERRIQQFTEYLRRMYERAHPQGHGSCFMIFSEQSGSDSRDNCLVESVELAAAIADGEAAGGASATRIEAPTPASPAEGWRADNSPRRFVQFSFERNWFCLDMPSCTLFLPEAQKILRDRSGFFYLRDRPEFTLYEEDVDGYDPFRKVYLYRDEPTAAEDLAYIFFDVWKFPIDWRFYATASTFGDGPSFERNHPVS